MPLLSTILAIILAILRVTPATLAAVKERQDVEAARRLQAKDALVDAAIDGDPKP